MNDYKKDAVSIDAATVFNQCDSPRPLCLRVRMISSSCLRAFVVEFPSASRITRTI